MLRPPCGRYGRCTRMGLRTEDEGELLWPERHLGGCHSRSIPTAGSQRPLPFIVPCFVGTTGTGMYLQSQ